MLGNLLTRRAALAGFGAFAAAALGGCNTTPSAGVQPIAGSGAAGPSASIRRRWWLMSAIPPPAGWSSPCPARSRAGSRVEGVWRSSRACRHAVSRQRWTRGSGSHDRRRDVGRPDNQCAGDLDVYFKPDGPGAAGTGAAGSGAGAVGRLRLPVEAKNRVVTRAVRGSRGRPPGALALARGAALPAAFLTVPRSRFVLTALAAASLRWACGWTPRSRHDVSLSSTS